MIAFVSYPFGTDMSQVFRLLRDHKVDFFDAASDIAIGSSLQQAILQAINECDLIVLVYSNQNANQAFEAGLALGLKKPLFSIITGQGSDYPDFLLDSPHVFSGAHDYPKLKFPFELFLKKIKSRKVKEKKKKKKEPKSNNLLYNWQEAFEEIRNKNEQYLEDFIEQMLNYYKLENIKSERKGEGFFADFSIWSDALSSVLGNPILIEVKKNINQRNIEGAQKKIQTAFQKTNAKSGIIFYSELAGDKEKILEATTANILFISFSDIIEKLRTQNFEEAIVSCRNELIHKPL